MSKSDELFKKLDYTKLVDNEDTIWYQKAKDNKVYEILFYIDERKVSHAISYYSKNGNLLKREGTLSIQELQAINEKCSEKGWLDEKV